MEINRNRLENSPYPVTGYGHGQFAPPPMSVAPAFAQPQQTRIDIENIEKSNDRKRVQISEQDTPRRYTQQESDYVSKHNRDFIY